MDVGFYIHAFKIVLMSYNIDFKTLRLWFLDGKGIVFLGLKSWMGREKGPRFILLSSEHGLVLLVILTKSVRCERFVPCCNYPYKPIRPSLVSRIVITFIIRMSARITGILLRITT